MSDVAPKSTPPGSWPCNKGESGEPAPERSAATPRSMPVVPEHQDYGRDDNMTSSVKDSQSGEYTHQNPLAKSQGKKEDRPEQEERQPIEMKDEAGSAAPEQEQKAIESKGVAPEPAGEKEQGEKAEEAKLPEGSTMEQQPQQQVEKQAEDQETKTGKYTSLTEKAKTAFDQASENQPTGEARDSFIQEATDNLAPQPQEEEQAINLEASEKSDAARAEMPENAEPETEQAAAASEKAEDIPAEQEKAESEAKEQVGLEGQEAATQEAEAPAEEAQAEPEEPKLDYSILKNGTVNKGGNVVSEDGEVIGRVVEGNIKDLVGKGVDENGNIFNKHGKVIGKAEPIPEDELEAIRRGPSPFENFPDAVVGKDGMVMSGEDIVGKVVEGDTIKLKGAKVDSDGDILDRNGNVIGKAERWEPEPEKEPEPEPEVDKSILAGKRVNKAGNVVDSNGTIFGRVVEGDVKRMVGRMCDKKGNILSESGDILGKADLVPEGEREGLKEGPFAELQGCTVAKDGTVVTPAGDIVGRLVSGDGKILFGRPVDEDGDILDKNGNVVGKAERWEPEKVEREKNPMSGRRVNREGNVVDQDGNVIGKLTSGELTICAGKEIDDDGDVVDYKGNTIGHCTLLEYIPKEEESPEEKAKREQAEEDKKLAKKMSIVIEQCLESIRPICKLITEKIDKAERTPEDERDEEQVVREVRPLIEEGGRILNEAKGAIKGLDPDGRIAANAKHKTAAREASPEEYHLADVLKELTGEVTQCIENAKRKLEDMPHAKKELNPLWALLNEPLFQILAAVGLLLAGVLNLVGRLLSGLGLGGIIDGLLGTLGLNRVLEGLGLGSLSKSLKSGKKGGGLLGGVLGG
ncbi:hypothetical protein C8A03DRAFT_38622 [Achaetomium macrosporum]|uniref:DUF6987 domain-containing protein n=1 Tax=Achaetomium macrosporum TaxID=79813 RepID=A0AAN7HA34_9PEZI|nr:hypothetical protein C8A03DRAFT_38622 [Achaetomium macrosporum]